MKKHSTITLEQLPPATNETVANPIPASKRLAANAPAISEAAANADFSEIRYAQCWEDADVLLEALDIRPGDTCFSIASGGDNTLAMLAKDPERVVAVDLNPSQLACLELRVAGFRRLDHGTLLELIGSRTSDRRQELYRECRPLLSTSAAKFWDQHSIDIQHGIGTAGKFERYFAMFRRRVLPLVHSRKKVARLLKGGSREECRNFYDTEWNTWRWRLVFRIFFSRFVMGQAGRDPAFFKYVEGSVSDRILKRAEHAMTELNPSENPYLRWILDGTHSGNALPFALRPENFDRIRNNLDRLEWHLSSVEGYLSSPGAPTFDRFNLSDIFEYMAEDNFHNLLRQIVDAGHLGSRLAYWNTLVPRSRPHFMSNELRSLDTLSHTLHLQDKAFFYNTFVAEEIR